jgi:glutamine cyclotransferase
LYEESKTYELKFNHELGLVLPTGKEGWYYDHEFGEGVSILNETELIELTWLEKNVHILDRDTLSIKRDFKLWPEFQQGWGITLDEKNRVLYASDSNDKIF